MARRRQIGFLQHSYLLVLVAVSLTAMLLPSSWTGGLISLVQVIVPFQHAATAVGDRIGESLPDGSELIPAADFQAVQIENEALQHQVAALSLQAGELQRQVDLLTATRSWDVDGHRLGWAGRLVPARVITDDVLPWRSSKLINAGTLQGVRRGSAVTSRYFTIDRGGDQGLDTGMAVLLKETLVGIVEQVGTHTARVKLLSDVTVQRKVRIGRFVDEGFAPLDQYYWLKGRGNGRMQIDHVDKRDVESGLIAIGDIVLADSQDEELPAALVIGKINSIERDLDNPLLSILKVHGVIDESKLRYVYVFDPQGPAGDGN